MISSQILRRYGAPLALLAVIGALVAVFFAFSSSALADSDVYDIDQGSYDGCWDTSNNFSDSGANQTPGNIGIRRDCYLYFDGVTIPSGAEIATATIDTTRFRCDAGTQLLAAAVDQANPSVPTSAANANGKTLTTASVDTDCADPIDVTALLEELYDSYDYSSGSPVLIYLLDDGSSSNSGLGYRAYEEPTVGTKDAELTVEYTLAPTPTPTPTPTATPTPTPTPAICTITKPYSIEVNNDPTVQLTAVDVSCN